MTLVADFLAGTLVVAAVIVVFLGLWMTGYCYIYSHFKPSADTETKQDFTVNTVGSGLAISMLTGGGVLMAVLGMPYSGIGSVYALPSADYAAAVPSKYYENWSEDKRLSYAAENMLRHQPKPPLEP